MEANVHTDRKLHVVGHVEKTLVWRVVGEMSTSFLRSTPFGLANNKMSGSIV